MKKDKLKNIVEESKITDLVDSKFLADFLGILQREVQRKTLAGYIPYKETPKGRRYNLKEAIQGFIAYQQEMISKKKKRFEDLEEQKLQAEIRQREAKAEREQICLAELKSEMHLSEDVKEFIENFAAVIKDTLSSIPEKMAIELSQLDTPSEVSIRIEQEVNEILKTLSNFEYKPSAKIES